MSDNKNSEMTPEEFQEAVDFMEELADEDSTHREPPANEVEALQRQLHDAEKKALRYQADMDNFRRRARRESEEQLRYATSPLLVDLLDAFDNLQRALESTNTNDAESPVVVGVKMVADQLNGILERHHCKLIESVGQPFDPNLHQAVQMMQSDDQPANHILHELRSGFRLHERVLRPAQVIVSTGSA